MAVWHVALIRLKCDIDGIDFVRFLHSLIVPDIYLQLLEFTEFIMSLIRRCLRFSPFPDDRLILFFLQNLIGGRSCHAKV